MKVINSGRVDAFVESGRPQLVSVPSVRLLNAAQALGFTATPAESGYCVHDGDDVYLFPALNDHVQVLWDPTVSADGREVVYTPVVPSESPISNEVERKLAEQMGYRVVRVACPESIVTLPVPSWLHFTHDVRQPRFFASEVDQNELRANITQLEAIRELCSPTG